VSYHGTSPGVGTISAAARQETGSTVSAGFRVTHRLEHHELKRKELV